MEVPVAIGGNKEIKILCMYYNHSVYVAEEFSADVFSPSFFVVENSRGRREDDHAERTGWEEQVDPGLDLVGLHVESGRDDAGFVESAVELDDDFAGAVVVYDFEFGDVTVALHDAEEFDDDFGGRADEDLAFAATLGVDDVVEAVVEYRYADHGGCLSAKRSERRPSPSVVLRKARVKTSSEFTIPQSLQRRSCHHRKKCYSSSVVYPQD